MGTISYVSSLLVESNTGTMPSHQAGDVIVVHAFRRSSTTLPTIPTRFEHGGFGSRSSSNRTFVASAITATSSSETLGTWTNAEFLVVAVYRDTVNNLTVGACRDQNSSGTTVNFSTLTISTVGSVPRQRSSTNSWVAAVAMINVNNSDGELPPAGMTNRASLAGATNGEVALHDSNGNVDWNATVAITISPTSAWTTNVFEIWDTGIAKTSSGGGGSMINGQSLVRGVVI